MLYTVFVYKLANGKFLLCPTPRQIDNTSLIKSEIPLVTESEFLYSDITLNNRIVDIVETHKDIEAWQIDGLVHMYMHKYGTNNVYGGSYTDNREVSVSDHIKFITEGLRELDDRRDTYNKLKNHTCNHDPANIKTYDRLASLKDAYHIDRNIINELEWLKNCIYQNGTFGLTNGTFGLTNGAFGLTNGTFGLTKYHACINNLRVVHERASKLFNLEQTIYHKKPDLFFDSRVLPYERTVYMYNPTDDDQLEPMIKSFELAIYTMINREDETLFDMEQINIQEERDCNVIRQLKETTLFNRKAATLDH